MSKLNKDDAVYLRTVADLLRSMDDDANAEVITAIAAKIDALIDGAERIADKWIVRKFD